ncbi:MAG TPA: hypothetical protein PKE63_02880 [Lacibacter sp.]|nr:hypothetical protein [Lacibacter sp.]HMO89555.1 hypothetical protein [Lacibacter sp.]HMP86190.1 hypothetical protein [Lacibacter sp.]
MAKDKAPVVGGIGGSLFAWITEPILLQAANPLVSQLVEVAAFSLIGGLIGEGVKLGFAYLKKKLDKKEDGNG